MEPAIRVLLYTALGIGLLAVNLWFFRSLYQSYGSPEYVIAPFNVIDPSGKTAGDKAGLALAQMMVARLSNLQALLQATHSSPAKPSSAPPDLSNQLAVTTLFVPRPVQIPTGLFEPVSISANVGGVEVGGIVAWVQKMLSHDHALVFTTYERADRAIIAADLGKLAPGARLWFESGKHPDDVATNAAYALIQLRLAEKQSGPIKDLELADFRSLMETIFRVDELNRKAAQGHTVEAKFIELLPSIEAQVEKLPNWPELRYLTASIAEGAHNSGKALLHYRALQGLPPDKTGADARIREAAAKRLAAVGASNKQPESERQEQFVKASHEFAQKMALAGAAPAIAFVTPDNPAIQAMWNSKARRYEVNPASIDTAGLPQYVALMSRFLERNYERCEKKIDDPLWWNEFRYSVVDYLIGTQDQFKGVMKFSEQFRLFAALKDLQEKAGVDTTTRLALELFDRFDCDWTRSTITDELIKINNERGFKQEVAIRAAMSGQGFPSTGSKT